MRPSWDEYFMLIAKLVSTRSTCNSRPTGAVLVKDKQILATGYNGSMPGAPHCSDEEMPDGSPYCHRRALNIADMDKYNYCRASHAEANAIAQAARYGVAIKGATLYVTLQPCFVCLKLLATAQIRRVYFELAYGSKDKARDRFWKQAAQEERVVAEAGFEVFEQLSISTAALDFIMPSLREITSRRRLAATAAAEAPEFVGAVESE
jgi:dCMP deaminase